MPSRAFGVGAAATTPHVLSTPPLRSESLGLLAGSCWPLGDFCAAILGRRVASTIHGTNTSFDETHAPHRPDGARTDRPDHAAAPLAPGSSPLSGPSDLRMGDRCADDSRSPCDRASRGQATALNAQNAGIFATDQGAATEVFERQAQAARGVDGLLQGERHQPVLVVPADAAADAHLHRALLRPQESDEGGSRRRPFVHGDCSGHHRRRSDAWVASRDLAADLRHVAAPVVRSQRSAHDSKTAALADATDSDSNRVGGPHLPRHHRGTGSLLGDDEPLDLRATARH